MPILFATLRAALVSSIIGAALFGSSLAPAQSDPAISIKAEDVIHWQIASAIQDESGQIRVIAYLTTDQGFSLYKHKTTVTNEQGFKLTSLVDPGTIEITDPVTGKPTYVYKEGEFNLFFDPTDKNTTTPKTFVVSIRYIACTEKICLFPHTQTLQIDVVPKDGGSSMTLAATGKAPEAPDNSAVAVNSGDDFESQMAAKLKNSDSFFIILLIVFLGGILTNLTPCVFPMIPITMRILSSQTRSPYRASIAYATGILLTYTALGILAASTGGFFGALLANKWFNLFFAVMMFVFGLTMLGFGNFSGLQTLGGRLGSGPPSLKNAFLMGTGAGLVAAPCTGPILALLLAITAQSGEMVRGSFLMFVYSFGFALPYVFLGSISAKATKVKAPAQVQLGVKLVFTGVMFTLGFYYLRIPFYSTLESLKGWWQPIYLTTLPLGLIGLIAVLWKRELQNNKTVQLIPALLIALGLFAVIRHNYDVGKEATAKAGIVWFHSEDEAFAAAKAQNKPILVDSWAEWCEACKKMDVTTFADPGVIAELNKKWILLKFDLTESNDKNDAIMERYGLASLPTLALVPSSGDMSKKELVAGYVTGPTLLNRLQAFAK